MLSFYNVMHHSLVFADGWKCLIDHVSHLPVILACVGLANRLPVFETCYEAEPGWSLPVIEAAAPPLLCS